MKRRLSDLLKGIGQIEIKGDVERAINGLQLDSRAVHLDDLFAAISGTQVDGHQYIQSAIKKGAVAILCERWPDMIIENVSYLKVPDSRKALAKVAASYYDHPSKKLKCVGVTGTNGKTTIATLLYNLSKDLGYAVGLISTIEILVREKRVETSMTTPDIITMHRLLGNMVEAGCSHVFMEVSSHAVDQLRIAEIDFEGGVFTNITHDHLDYHGSFRNYIEAKQAFFKLLGDEAFAITNIDDKNGGVMLEHCKANRLSYSLRTVADYKARVLSEDSLGIYLEINNYKLNSRLTGRFNVYNLTAVYAVADQLQLSSEKELIVALSALRPISGRMELVWEEPRILVDYAHTPDALENVLKTIKSVSYGGDLITVVGCGGDRDQSKRPKMRQVATHYSDRVILTSDNPRSENPEVILNEMLSGAEDKELQKIIKITDRRSAIQTAIALASKRDNILIAGKGHEQYQEIKGKRFFFSDQKTVKDILSKDI